MRYREPFEAPLGSTESWRSRASNGATGASWGGRNPRQRRAQRLPDLGRWRKRRYGAQQGEPVGATGSQERGEHAGDARRADELRSMELVGRGGGELQRRWVTELEQKREQERRGSRSMSSLWLQNASQWARGRPDGDVTAKAIRRPGTEKIGRW